MKFAISIVVTLSLGIALFRTAGATAGPGIIAPSGDTPLRLVYRSDDSALFVHEGSVENGGGQLHLWTLLIAQEDQRSPFGMPKLGTWLRHEIDCAARTDRLVNSADLWPNLTNSPTYNYPKADAAPVSGMIDSVVDEFCNKNAAPAPARVANAGEAVRLVRGAAETH